MWGGRFGEKAHESLAALNNSLPIDKRLYDEDLTGSVAYAKALQKVQLITVEEYEAMVAGLEEVRKEWQSGAIVFQPGDEDVHTVNERRLTELVGVDVGGKLHTGRSRNDQVATDMRLWMKKAVTDLQRDLREVVVDIICPMAEQWIHVLMPGYTHLQRAQVIRFSHWLLSYGFYFESDYKRLADLLPRVDCLPLGSGAIAGNPFGIDREELAKELGFKEITRNSMFAVGDRDFVGEYTGIVFYYSFFTLPFFVFQWTLTTQTVSPVCT